MTTYRETLEIETWNKMVKVQSTYKFLIPWIFQFIQDQPTVQDVSQLPPTTFQMESLLNEIHVMDSGTKQGPVQGPAIADFALQQDWAQEFLINEQNVRVSVGWDEQSRCIGTIDWLSYVFHFFVLFRYRVLRGPGTTFQQSLIQFGTKPLERVESFHKSRVKGQGFTMECNRRPRISSTIQNGLVSIPTPRLPLGIKQN